VKAAVRYQMGIADTIRKPSNPASEAGTRERSELFAAPPTFAAGFRSDDLDEVRAFIARYDGNHRRIALGRGALGYSMRTARCGAIDLGWMRSGMRQKVSGVPHGTILQLPMGRPHVYAIGDRAFEARPGAAILLAAGQEFTIYTEPNDCLVVLRVGASALSDELRDRLPASAGLVTREIALTGGRLEALASMHRALVQAADPQASSSHRPYAAQLEARVIGWLADCLVGTNPASTRPAVTVQRVRMVEEWVDTHLAAPITLGRLCAVAGVGDRWLESAFRAHRGQTPLGFVMARRLARVRRSLLDATPGASITQLAHDAGFVHLGRFAARYRRAYGESPSQTLQRSLRRA